MLLCKPISAGDAGEQRAGMHAFTGQKAVRKEGTIPNLSFLTGSVVL
jgi:hypothetical protein